MSNVYNAAKVLDQLLQEIVALQETVPQHIIDDLKTGRSYANILRRSPLDTEVAEKASIVLETAAMNLLALAETHKGAAFADAWQERIAAAYDEELPPLVSSSVFAAGLPKGVYWIRYQTAELKRIITVNELLQQHDLSTIEQDDGFTLVYGIKDQVLAFLHEIRHLIEELG